MKQYTVAVLGATGAVGQEMIKILQERNFPVGRLVPLASARSAGKTIPFRGGEVAVAEACDAAFEGVDIVLGAAENDIAERFAPAIVKAGAVFVDNSSAFRLNPDVPLIVPEVNPEDVKKHRGILSNPNCSTIIAVTAVNALNSIAPIRTMTVSTYQAVSGAGVAGPRELTEQVEALRNGETVVPKVFSYQIAYNLIPQIGGEQFEGYTSEEMKMQNEGRKIMHLPELKVSCTCVRVPVVRSHSISVSCHFDVPVTAEQARQAIAGAPGCRLVDDLKNKRYPMPLETSDQDIVFVGRIRPDLTDDNGICLWCCGDQVRKGAATNAVQIAELLVKEGGRTMSEDIPCCDEGFIFSKKPNEEEKVESSAQRVISLLKTVSELYPEEEVCYLISKAARLGGYPKLDTRYCTDDAVAEGLRKMIARKEIRSR